MGRTKVKGIISRLEEEQKDLSEVDLHDSCSSCDQDLAFQPDLHILVLRERDLDLSNREESKLSWICPRMGGDCASGTKSTSGKIASFSLLP